MLNLLRQLNLTKVSLSPVWISSQGELVSPTDQSYKSNFYVNVYDNNHQKKSGKQMRAINLKSSSSFKEKTMKNVTLKHQIV